MKHNRLYTQLSRIKRFLREIRDALAGTEYDYTTLSIRKALILLSIPMVLEMLMESVFVIFDIYFVSKLGAEAVSIVGITESILTLVYAFSIGFSISATAIVSRRIGEKEPRKASHAAFQSLFVTILVSIVISLIGLFFCDDMLRLMGASQVSIQQYSGYTRWMIVGNASIMLLFVLNGILRGAGDAAIAMRVLWLANMINIVLDPMLIFGIGPFPALGIDGAAIATNCGRGIGVLYQLYSLIFGTRSRLRFNVHDLIPDFPQIVAYLKLSFAGIMQMLIATSSWIGLVRIISSFGSISVAGYTVGIRIMIFALLPASGISNAAATLVGQNLGAKNAHQAERSAWISGIVNGIFMGLIGLIIVLFPEPIISFLTHDPQIIEKGAECMRIMSIGFAAYGFGMVIVHSLNGAGDTYTPMIINLICFWLLEIPLAYFLAIKMNMNERGVYYAIVIAETAMTLSAIIMFKRGKWKLQRV
jgi:putative MATE family efflux protein